MSDDYLIQHYGREQGLDPCEILIEKEERQIIIELFRELAIKLSRDDMKLLEMYVIDRETQENIAKELGVTQQAISYRIDNLYKKIEKFCKHDTYIICKGILLDKPSMKEADTPKYHIGWLTNAMMKVNDGGEWQDEVWDNGNKARRYITKSKCIIDQYTPAICSQCGFKCKNENMKARAEKKKKF